MSLYIRGAILIFVCGVIGLGIILILNSGTQTGNNTGTDSSLQSTVIPGQVIPMPLGYVNDKAGVLTASTTEVLEKNMSDFAASGRGEVAVLIIKSLDGLSIEEYGIRVAEAWKVGKYEVNNGNILIISVEDRKVRLETGSNSGITDGEASRILANVIVPSLKRGDWNGAVGSGISAIILESGAN